MQQHKPYKIPVFGLPKCRINVIVEYDDGTTQRLQTDDKGWKVTANGPIRSNNEYDGEEYDARMEMAGWAEVGYDDSQWLKAQRTDIPTGQLRGQMTPSMLVQSYHRLWKPTKTIPGPVEWKELKPLPGKPDTYVIDFGQNMAGWVSLMPHGKAGDTIRFSSPVATAEFSKFAGILSRALSQHHLIGFEISQLEFHHLH